MIDVRGLGFAYEVRVIDPKRSWLRNLLWSEYRSHPVLEELDLCVEGSGITALLGRNGAGKTTLIKLLCGILTPSCGSIRVLGFEPARRQRELLSQVGVIFGQKKMLWPELTLRENLELIRALYRVPHRQHAEQVGELIPLFGLDELAHRPLKSYSLGESMKAEVLAVLSFRPRLLFLDEPTIGMDVGAQRALRDSLRRYIAQHNCRAILTSHNLRDVSALATEIFFLEGGRLDSFQPPSAHEDVETALERRLAG